MPKSDLPVYGMDKEILAKQEAKRNPEREAAAQKWLEELTGLKFADPSDWEESLKDGVLLCKAVNVIKPGSVKKVKKSKMKFVQMQNVNNFLEACKKLGLPKHDLFVTIDLCEGKNIPAVVDCIFALGSVCISKKDWNGPVLGKKRSEKKEYKFTEEQLLKSRSAPTLFSKGGQGCASQAGTRDHSRDVVKTKDQGIRGTVSKLSEGGKGCASQAGTKYLGNNVIRTKDTGSKGSVSILNEGGKGCSSQAGTKYIGNNVIRTKDTGSKGSVSRLNEGGKGCSSQAGTKYIGNNVIRTKDTGLKGSVSKLNEGAKGCPSQAGNKSISNEVVKLK